MQADKTYTAFLGFIGRPNSGKSTLMNKILGQGLSIVSPMPQTTQKLMRGIFTDGDTQVIMMDTPGIHRGKHLLNQKLYEQGLSILKDSGIDIICYMVDASRSFGDEEDEVAHKIEKSNTKAKVVVIFNKVDKIDIAKGMAKEKEFNERYPFLANAPKLHLSALADDTAKKFIDSIKEFIPEGPHFYSPEDVTDADLRFIATECLRKQIIDLTHEEVPHSVFISIISYKEDETEHEIAADIHVETSGQKAIIIGHRGQLLSKIRQNAQKRMRGISGIKTKFTLFVKITPNWREKGDFLSSAGF